MRQVITLFLLMLISSSLFASYDFSAIAPSGQTLYYKILGTKVNLTYPGGNYANPYANYTEPRGALVIPDSVSNGNRTYAVSGIDDHVFFYCVGLTSVTIPNSVHTIGARAFYGCLRLTSVTIPNSVTTIGEGALYNCRSLRLVTISNSVTSIGSDAFYDVNCIYYTGTASGRPWGAGNVATYKENGFYYADYNGHSASEKVYVVGCDEDLSTITIPNSVVAIGNGAFYYCVHITSVTIPNSVMIIGAAAFAYDTNITAITIPNSVTSIGSSAFRSTKISSVTIPNGVTYIGEEAFRECKNLVTVNFNADSCICGFSPFGGSRYSYFGDTWITNVRTVNIGENVRVIPSGAFAECTRLTTVNIPNSVTTIGSGAFNRCTGLTTVDIPNGVTTIGPNAFSGCTFLSSIRLSNHVVSIGDSAFFRCNGLSEVRIPRDVTYVGRSAFGKCIGLSTVFFEADSCLYMGESRYPVFDSCRNIQTISISNNIRNIPPYAFCRCTGITSITIPNHIKYIGDGAFSDCMGLVRVDFNADFCEYMGSSNNSVFSGCSNLETINIGENVRSIPSYAFKGLASNFLDVFEIPSTVTSIGNCSFSDFRCIYYTGTAQGSPWCAYNHAEYIEDGFYYSTYNGHNASEKVRLVGYSGTLTHLSIPSSVKVVGAHVFQNCSQLTSVTIPNSVTTVGDYAFYGCRSLDSIIIPENVRVGYNAFANCYGASYLSFGYGSTSETRHSGNSFLGCTGLRTLEYNASVLESGFLPYESKRNLTTVMIGERVTRIGDTAFRKCKRLRTISFNAINCTSVGRNENMRAFWGCDNVMTINIGDLVTQIPAHTFQGCYSTKYLRLGESLETVGDYAFLSGFDSVSHLRIPDACRHIGKMAFAGSFEVDTLTLGVNIESVGESAFDGFYKVVNYNTADCDFSNAGVHVVRTLNIGSSVLKIYPSAFEGNSSMVAISIPTNNNIVSIGANAFKGCSQMAGSIVVPHISELGNQAFYGCALISSVELGDNLSSIGTYTFYGCDHMTRLTLGRGLTTIANNAFMGCTEIRQITSRAWNPPTVYNGTFADMDDDITVRVPCIAADAYHNAPYWSHFTNIEGQFEWFFSATSGDITQGGVTVVNTPTCSNRQAEILATPYYGYHLDRWSDGNRQNPRYVVVTSDTMLTAIFEPNSYVVYAAASNAAMGAVAGSGTYRYGDAITLTATAYDGYRFDHWNNGVSENPYTFTLVDDIHLEAIFVEDNSTGIVIPEQCRPSIRLVGRQIVVCGADGLSVSIYDIQGRPLETKHAAFGQTIRFDVPATGVYMVRVGNIKAQRVAVLR